MLRQQVPRSPQDEESLLEEFELLWRKGSPVRIESFLKRADPAARSQLLHELIKIELEYRWRQAKGYRPLLEDYVVRFPELGPPGRLSEDLIGEEYRVRQRWGDRPGHLEYSVRFSGQVSQLEALFRRIDHELKGEYQPAGRPRPHPESLPSQIPWAVPVQSLTRPAELIGFLTEHQIVQRQQLDTLPSTSDLHALARELVRRGWLTFYQLNRLLTGRGLELLLGPYVFLDELGVGSTGWVMKARHRHLNRLVTLKVLRQELLADLTSLRRFYRELELLSRLSHPHVIQAHDGGPLGPTHVLVLEYVPGIDLGRLVQQSGPLPVERACEYIRQAALGLQHIHECGLVHRDIAPSNLLLASRERERPENLVKILDLGLARLRHDAGGFGPGARHRGGSSAWLAGAGSVVVGGTPDYIAPEQALNFHKVDIRADIYSLGCTLYYLLTGQPPYPGGNLTQKLLRHQSEQPPSLGKLRPAAPAWLNELLPNMLAKAPAGRFAEPIEVAQVLARALGRPAAPPVAAAAPAAQGPTLAGEPFAFAWEKKTRKRPSWLWWLLALPLLVLASTLAVMAWKSNPDRQTKATPPALPLPKVVEVPWLDFAHGFVATKDLMLNGSAVLDGHVLRLTANEPNQAGSAFTRSKARINRFETRFRFRLLNAQADGITFTIQGVSPGALGPSGGGLGYGPHLAAEHGGIPRSMAIKFDIFDNEGEGISSTGLYTNGVAPTVAHSISLIPVNIHLHNGHEYAVTMTYDGHALKVTIDDTQTHARATQSYDVDIPRLVGGPEAYVGFTGGTGGNTANQQILSWTFQPK